MTIAVVHRNLPWLPALLLSVLLHGALLLIPGWTRVATGPNLHTSAMSFRMAPLQPPTRDGSVVAAVGQEAAFTPSETETQASTDARSETQTPASERGEAAFGTYYFAPDELTAKPVFLRDDGAPTPKYMPDVMPLPVLASVFIDEHGHVDNVVLGESFLSDAAKSFITESFLAMQFSPGLLGSQPVKSRLIVEVKLDPALTSN